MYIFESATFRAKLHAGAWHRIRPDALNWLIIYSFHIFVYIHFRYQFINLILENRWLEML